MSETFSLLYIEKKHSQFSVDGRNPILKNVKIVYNALLQCSSRIDFICHPWGDWREAKFSPKQFPTLERKLTSTEEENPCCCFFETWTVAFIKGCTLSRSKQRVTKICFSSALSRRSDWLLSCHTLQCWLVKSGNSDHWVWRRIWCNWCI